MSTRAPRGGNLDSLLSAHRANLPIKYPRRPDYRPRPEDNPLGAWYWRCQIRGAPDGLLADKTVTIKVRACVAGDPLMNGTSSVDP